MRTRIGVGLANCVATRDPARQHRRVTFSDFGPAGNQGGNPDVYEIENRALDPEGLVLAAMRELAPWRDRTLVDLGCGSGFWLPGYADEAARVIGVEPDERLVPLAADRDARVP